MKCSLGISNFLEEISSLSQSIVEDIMCKETGRLRCSQLPSGGYFRKDRLWDPGWETWDQVSHPLGCTQVEEEEDVRRFRVDFEGRVNSTG